MKTAPLIIADIAASIVSLCLVVGCLVLAYTEKDIPAEVGTALGAALTWLFVRAALQPTLNGADTPREREPTREETSNDHP